MINIAICDDESIIVSQIEAILLEVSKAEHISVNTEAFYSGQSLDDAVNNGASYDLIYLDIQMANGDGIATAKNVRKKDEDALLIYVSGYDEYMMELFELDVFAFIKKPIDKARFTKIFLDAVRKISSQLVYFPFEYKKEQYKVLCMDILYFESSGRKISIHLRDRDNKIFYGKLSDVERYLSDGKIPFLRIHQSYLVNYHHIQSRTKTEVTLTNGTKLPISEDRRKDFGTAYGRLLGNDIDI